MTGVTDAQDIGGRQMQERAQKYQTMRLGDILVEREIITEDQLARSIRYQSETGARIGEALMKLGFITSLELNEALAWQSTYGMSGFGELLPHPAAAKLLTERFCGRIGLYEVMPVSREIRELILNHGTADNIREQAAALGVRSLREDGRLKVLQGVTTVGEVLRVTT